MDARSWKVIAVFCLFAGNRLLLGVGAFALLMACFDNSMQRAAFGVICLIGAQLVRPEKWVSLPSQESPPDPP